MLRSLGLLEIVTGVSVTTAGRYLFFAGVAWALGYIFFHKRWLHRKIIQKFPESADIRREIGDSLVTLVIFGLVGVLTILAGQRGWTQMYFRISEHGWGWWWASIGLTILLHDAWFYWTHRLMHHPKRSACSTARIIFPPIPPRGPPSLLVLPKPWSRPPFFRWRSPSCRCIR